MAQLQPSKFCTYVLEPSEEKRGRILTIENLYVIQNMIAQLALEKIELAATRQDFDNYWQQEAELQGSIKVLQQLVDQHHSTMSELENIDARDAGYYSEVSQGIQDPAQIFSPPSNI